MKGQLSAKCACAKQWCLQHKVLAVCLAVQLLVVLYFVVALFMPKTIIELSLDSFAATSESNSVSMTGNDLHIQNEAGDTTEITLNSDSFSLAPAAYLLKVSYQSVYQLDAPTGSQFEETSVVSLATNEMQSLFVETERLLLKDSEKSGETRIIVSYGAAVQDVNVALYYNGTGSATISSIVIEEQLAWRYVTLLGVLIALALVDAFAYLVLAPNTGRSEVRRQKIKTFFILFGISVVANLPLFADYVYNGADFLFHCTRIGAVAAELLNGQFPVRMMTEVLNGYGYANSLFYCDIFLYLPAVLYNCMVPLRTTYQIYAFLTHFATAAICYYVFFKMVNHRWIAWAGTVVYTLSSYRLANVYTRASVGEYTALIFFPLIALGVWNIYRAEKPRYQDWLPLALGMAGIVQCHMISLEIAIVFLCLLCLLLLKQTLVFARIKSFVCAALLCLGLGAWFWVPFLQSLVGMELKYSTIVATEIQSKGLDMLEMFTISNAEYRLGWGVMLGVGLVVYYVIEHRKYQLKHEWEFAPMCLTAGIGVFVFAISSLYFPWNLLAYGISPSLASIVNLIQAPWRCLPVALICFTVAVVLALCLLRKKHPAYFKSALITLFVANLVFTGLFYLDFTEYAEKLELNNLSGFENAYYTVSAGEYVLTGTDLEDFDSTLVRTSSDDVTVLHYEKIDGVAYATYQNDSAEAQTLLFPIWNYLNYQATDAETGEQLAITTGENNRISVAVPAGASGTVQVAYVAPMLWHVAEGITLLSWAFVAFMAIKRKRQAKKQGVQAQGALQPDPTPTSEV